MPRVTDRTVAATAAQQRPDIAVGTGMLALALALVLALIARPRNTDPRTPVR